MHVRVAELVGALSLATDMGAGLPLQSAISATILATRMAVRLGLSEEEQRVTYYTGILRFIGCSSAAPEAGQLGAGDDQGLMYALGMCDMADADDVAQALDRYWNTSADPRVRREIIRSLSEDLSQVAEAAAMHCAQAVVLSRRMPVGERVTQMLAHMYDRFDGQGSTAAGDDIPLPARLCCLAADTCVVLRSLGKQAALDLVLPRAGGQFCPECTDLLDKDSEELLAGLDDPSCWECYIDMEPGEGRVLVGADLDRACTAYADYGDQRSSFLLGHSRHVASSSFLAAQAAGVDRAEWEDLRLAALLHDVGRGGVPATLWDKRDALTYHERQLLESHNGHTETILGLSPSLAGLARHASGVHERADSTGYPRAARLDDRTTGLLAAADVYEALTHDRPWRTALSAEEASNMLLKEATEGRLPRRAVGAVLDAAGHARTATDAVYPCNLSRREVEVLGLLANGLSTKQIADRLEMAPKTAENHIGKIYDKTGARGRANAALFAVEHGLNEHSLTPRS